jgi:transcription elongation factor GreA
VILMQAEHEIVLTASGLKKIEDELERLKTIHRKRVADRIREAMEHGGDLTDNTEYEEAKNEQGMVEGRIEELRQILGAARVLEIDEVQTDQVSVGSIVKVRDNDSNDEWEWTIVGTFEADPGEDRISNESPVGEALMSKRVGETAEVDIPAGTAKYTVLGIRK